VTNFIASKHVRVQTEHCSGNSWTMWRNDSMWFRL